MFVGMCQHDTLSRTINLGIREFPREVVMEGTFLGFHICWGQFICLLESRNHIMKVVVLSVCAVKVFPVNGFLEGCMIKQIGTALFCDIGKTSGGVVPLS